MKQLFIRLREVNYILYLKRNKVLLAKYVFSGISSMLIELSLFYVLIHTSDLNAVLSSNISLLLAGVFNYCLSRYWVFEKTSNLRREIILFAVIFFVSLFINNAIFILSMHVLKLSPMSSKCMAIIVSTGFNYLTKKYLVFKEFEPVRTS